MIYTIIACITLASVWHVTGHDPLYWLIHGLVRLRAGLTLMYKVGQWAWSKYRQELGTEIQLHELELLAGRQREAEL